MLTIYSRTGVTFGCGCPDLKNPSYSCAPEYPDWYGGLLGTVDHDFLETGGLQLGVDWTVNLYPSKENIKYKSQ